MDAHSLVTRSIEKYQSTRDTRQVFPGKEELAALAQLPETLPADGLPLHEVVRLLDEVVAPATVLTTSGRYFGFVTGGSTPAAKAAHMLATEWDQNTSLTVMSPVAVRLEETALAWIARLLRIPAEAAGVFVTGATMANFTGMAAARHALLAAKGYDVETQGLFGAPAFPVVVGEEAHASLFKALGMLGLGRDRVIRVPVDSQGRMDPAQFPALEEPALVCLQAGNVNTGALDSPELITLAKRSGSWVHIDGAFGLWGREANYAEADSWATDGHKWLNVPYDSGIAYVRDAQAMTAAFTVAASYLNSAGGIEPMMKAPESSRRARGIDAWAALLALGEHGLRAAIEICCRHARTIATTLGHNGFEILNDVTLNQVLVALPTNEATAAWIAAVQREGTCWAGSTVYRGRQAMRISISSFATTDADVSRSLAAMLRAKPR